MERLANLVINPHLWLGGTPAQARHQFDTMIPLKSFSIDDFAKQFETRLILLGQAEWETLGLAVALLPYVGGIENSMDGRFRRAVEARFSEDQVKLLDSIVFTEPSPAFLLSRKSWEHPELVAHSGVQSIIELVQWSEGQRQFMQQRFVTVQPAVSHLTITLVEDLCKISLPNLPWLFENKDSTAPQASTK